MNKKLLLGVLCVAIVGIVATSVVADTWISRFKTIRFFTGSTVNFALYENCEGTMPICTNVLTVAQGQHYQFTLYAYNNGTNLLYITYLPTTISQDGGQTRMTITVDVIEYGVPSQMGGAVPLPTGISSLPWVMPEKSISNPTNGFPLAPTKMIKLLVEVRVDSIDMSAAWPKDINFEVVGVSV